MISSDDDDIDEEFQEGDAFDYTRVCFKGEDEIITWSKSKLLVGPCDHMYCKVWHLELIHSTEPYDTPVFNQLK